MGVAIIIQKFVTMTRLPCLDIVRVIGDWAFFAVHSKVILGTLVVRIFGFRHRFEYSSVMVVPLPITGNSNMVSLFTIKD